MTLPSRALSSTSVLHLPASASTSEVLDMITPRLTGLTLQDLNRGGNNDSSSSSSSEASTVVDRAVETLTSEDREEILLDCLLRQDRRRCQGEQTGLTAVLYFLVMVGFLVGRATAVTIAPSVDSTTEEYRIAHLCVHLHRILFMGAVFLAVALLDIRNLYSRMAGLTLLMALCLFYHPLPGAEGAAITPTIQSRIRDTWNKWEESVNASWLTPQASYAENNLIKAQLKNFHQAKVKRQKNGRLRFVKPEPPDALLHYHWENGRWILQRSDRQRRYLDPLNPNNDGRLILAQALPLLIDIDHKATGQPAWYHSVWMLKKLKKDTDDPVLHMLIELATLKATPATWEKYRNLARAIKVKGELGPFSTVYDVAIKKDVPMGKLHPIVNRGFVIEPTNRQKRDVHGARLGEPLLRGLPYNDADFYMANQWRKGEKPSSRRIQLADGQNVSIHVPVEISGEGVPEWQPLKRPPAPEKEDPAPFTTVLPHEMATNEREFEAFDCSSPRDLRVIQPATDDGCEKEDARQVTEDREPRRFLVLQELPHTRSVAKECVMRRSRLPFYCGNYDHVTIDTESLWYQVPVKISVDDCIQMQGGKYAVETMPEDQVIKDETYTLRNGAVNQVRYVAVGRNYHYTGEIECEGARFCRDDKSCTENMVVLNQDDISLDDQPILFSENGQVTLHRDQQVLPDLCTASRGHCVTDRGTWYWKAPTAQENCLLYRTRAALGKIHTALERDDAESNVFIDDEQKIRLVLKEKITRCSCGVWPTSHDNIFLTDQVDCPAFQRVVDPKDMRWDSFTKIQDAYLTNHVLTSTRDLVNRMLNFACRQEAKKQKKEFALLAGKQRGIMDGTTVSLGYDMFATAAGEAFNVYRCRKVLVFAPDLDECYDALPVRLDKDDRDLALRVEKENRQRMLKNGFDSKSLIPLGQVQFYMEPVTKILTTISSPRQCAPHLNNVFQSRSGLFITATPYIMPVRTPETMPHLVARMETTELKEVDFADAGIYSPEALEKMQRAKDMPHVKRQFIEALTNADLGPSFTMERRRDHLMQMAGIPSMTFWSFIKDVGRFLHTWGYLFSLVVAFYSIGCMVMSLARFIKDLLRPDYQIGNGKCTRFLFALCPPLFLLGKLLCRAPARLIALGPLPLRRQGEDEEDEEGAHHRFLDPSESPRRSPSPPPPGGKGGSSREPSGTAGSTGRGSRWADAPHRSGDEGLGSATSSGLREGLPGGKGAAPAGEPKARPVLGLEELPLVHGPAGRSKEEPPQGAGLYPSLKKPRWSDATTDLTTPQDSDLEGGAPKSLLRLRREAAVVGPTGPAGPKACQTARNPQSRGVLVLPNQAWYDTVAGPPIPVPTAPVEASGTGTGAEDPPQAAAKRKSLLEERAKRHSQRLKNLPAGTSSHDWLYRRLPQTKGQAGQKEVAADGKPDDSSTGPNSQMPNSALADPLPVDAGLGPLGVGLEPPLRPPAGSGPASPLQPTVMSVQLQHLSPAGGLPLVGPRLPRPGLPLPPLLPPRPPPLHSSRPLPPVPPRPLQGEGSETSPPSPKKEGHQHLGGNTLTQLINAEIDKLLPHPPSAAAADPAGRAEPGERADLPQSMEVGARGQGWSRGPPVAPKPEKLRRRPAGGAVEPGHLSSASEEPGPPEEEGPDLPSPPATSERHPGCPPEIAYPGKAVDRSQASDCRLLDSLPLPPTTTWTGSGSARPLSYQRALAEAPRVVAGPGFERPRGRPSQEVTVKPAGVTATAFEDAGGKKKVHWPPAASLSSSSSPSPAPPPSTVLGPRVEE